MTSLFRKKRKPSNIKLIKKINANATQDNVFTNLLFETGSNNNIILGNTRTN